MHTFHIETVGCQMNVLDSELVTASLLQEGFRYVDSPQQADILLFNTCSIRQHAEDKIYSALGRLKHRKERHPERIIGVLGCMAQKEAEEIFRRAPHVELVVGPGQISRIPELIRKIHAGEGAQLELSLERKCRSRREVESSFDFFAPLRAGAARANPYQAFVRIMLGCDQFCTYCIVPHVRGPEQSRPEEEILAEIRQLAEQGCREVTLIGQTVSKYRSPGTRLPLSGLLEKVHALTSRGGLERIRFVTSHPNSMTKELLEAVRDLPSVMPFFHIPAQSGSNAVLKRMNRGYTVEKYREVLAAIRETVPGASITSDFIVGFCGETEDDFQKTIRLVEEARFKNSFIFKYSPRKGTKASELWKDDVPEEAKRRRNNELLALQNRISEEESAQFLGRTVEILVEGASKKGENLPIYGEATKLQLTGHTPCDRIVVFEGGLEMAGTIRTVTIEKTSAFTLFGNVGDLGSNKTI